MQSFRRLALLLAFTCAALPAAFAQSSSDSTTGGSQSSSQAGSTQPSAGELQGQATVQARIRQRREQRRATAIHDAYDHRWETYLNLGFLRFIPGPSQQRLNFYAWNTGLTRYWNERLGFTLDGRGSYGIAYVGINTYSQGGFTRPQVSMYNILFGPTYRFYMQPKYSIAGRVMGGWSYGNFSGDTNGISPTLLGLYPDGSTFGLSISIVGEYNLTPSVAFRIAPEYLATGFGSTVQNSRGFTGGIVYRFGKQ